MTTGRERVGRYMENVRRQNGLTQKQVALGAEVARVTVHEWEAGTRMPGVLTFIAWCRAVRADPAQAITAVEMLVEDSIGGARACNDSLFAGRALRVAGEIAQRGGDDCPVLSSLTPASAPPRSPYRLVNHKSTSVGK